MSEESQQSLAISVNLSETQPKEEQLQQEALVPDQEPEHVEPTETESTISQTITDDAEKLKILNAEVAETEKEATERKEDVDARSIYVGNVDYEASPEELQRHFQEIGPINRVTILLNKFTGKPKGFAYIEFAEPASVSKSFSLNDSIFRNRNLKVVAKRTNIPGFNGRGRGGFRGRGAPRGRGGFRGGRGRFTPY